MSEEVGRSEQYASATDAQRAYGFSDGCFAIIITLLVIEIPRPEAEPGGLGLALLRAWPAYAAFALAFIYVGVIWLNHHGVFRLIRRVDVRLNAINLGIIGTAALMPFPTGILAEAFSVGNLADERAAVVLYGTIAALMSAAWAPLFPYLERNRQTLKAEVPPGYFRKQQVRPWMGVLAYLAAISAGWFVDPRLAIAGFVLMIAYHAWTSEGVNDRTPVISPKRNK